MNMKSTYLPYIFAVTLILGCNSNKHQHSDFINLNDYAPPSAKMQKVVFCEEYGGPLLMWDYEYKGNQFLLGSNPQGRIKYILSKDSSFVTPEGIRIGETQVNLKTIGDPIIEERLQGHYKVRLPSGWIVQVNDGSTININTDSIKIVPPKKTIITIIYKM